VVALQPPELLLELVAVLGGFELGDPLLRGREGDPDAVLAGLEREGDREVTFAGAGRVGVALLTLSIRYRGGCASCVRRATSVTSS
jgi:hypothetical protein